MSAEVATNSSVFVEADSRADQIRKVIRLSKAAKYFFMWMTIVAAAGVFFGAVLILVGPLNANWRITMTTWDAVGPQTASLQVKTAALVLVAPFVYIVFAILRHLNLLFTSLSNGFIYTKDNVRHILQVGRLWLIFGVMSLALPIITMIPLWIGFIDERSVTMVNYKLPSGIFTSMISASLVILIAWIMDVGRQTQDEAVKLREEADLVV